MCATFNIHGFEYLMTFVLFIYVASCRQREVSKSYPRTFLSIDIFINAQRMQFCWLNFMAMPTLTFCGGLCTLEMSPIWLDGLFVCIWKWSTKKHDNGCAIIVVKRGKAVKTKDKIVIRNRSDSTQIRFHMRVKNTIGLLKMIYCQRKVEVSISWDNHGRN